MCLEELIKGSNSGLRRTGDHLLVQDDVKILDAVLSLSDTQKKELSRASLLQEGVHASSHLWEGERERDEEKLINKIEVN